MRLQLTIGLSCIGAALVGVALMVACSTESASENNVRITPDNVRLAKGQSQQFTASGGYEYTWSLEGGTLVDEWGRLSASRGPTTVYTSTKDASTAGTFRVIHVTSTIPGSDTGGTTGTGTGTNTPTPTTAYSMPAEAFVEHAVKYGSLNVSPASVSGFKYGSFQTFTADGGDGAYSWNLLDSVLGELSTTVGPNTTYSSTSRATDDNTVNRLSLTSGDGQTVNVVIYHANESVTNPVTALSLSPVTADAVVNESVTFTASGGDGAYIWSLSTREYGSLTFASANTATYLCKAVDPTNTVVVRLKVQSNGETRQATIVHSPSTTDDLRISPAYATLAQGQSTTFTASGGSGDYTWDVSSTNYGRMTVSSPTTASYVSMVFVPTNAPVTVTITVTDSDFNSVDAQIIHRN